MSPLNGVFERNILGEYIVPNLWYLSSVHSSARNGPCFADYGIGDLQGPGDLVTGLHVLTNWHILV